MASPSDRFAGAGCWLTARAGQTASPTDNSMCLMDFLGPVVRSSPHTRSEQQGFRVKTTASTARESNSVPPAAKRSGGRRPLGREVARGDFPLEQPARTVHPQVYQLVGAASRAHVAPLCRVAVQGRALDA